ncbi:MAG TPA: SUMF1/EgtB/PvdO family nonheme iron enzyme, partial [Thermoanaerobaculia bacterium]|nr:SUMF1/EgtB/PvdO family nonheme iron enzyme [Thermoanaerobaculia bacterium]
GRERLPLPDQRTLFDYLGRVRERALETLERWAEEGAKGDRLLAGGFAFELVAEHEEQHHETVLQALQVMAEPPYVPALRRKLPPGAPVPDEMVRVAAGPFQLGTDAEGFVYDNERRAHEVHLPAFWIDAVPVTQGAYARFVDDGGYRRPELWSEPGRTWREASGAEAAAWDPVSGTKRRYPWGDKPPTPERANVDQLAFAPAPAGAYPKGASAYGAQQMVGDVWEWTASDFGPYPGFEAYPYAEYSEAFFGPDYKVLRGGSWATRPAVARATFRNGDLPVRRQIFSGFRCARDD